ncbi:MAG: hypothetical protein DLM72_19260 [Candidatus Nitrosopolaris wilkensis]|nr:MAG: hypothetical protein DLM72_19260 [Candidatus Nitrosopolaris wilkensis]
MILNITAAVASSLGIIAVYRHGLHGVHGGSYLFLTLGIISWFAADLTLAYYYFALGIEEQILVSVTDVLWFIGYLFLAAHLFTVVRFIHSRIKLMTIILTSIVTLLFITYITINIFPSSRFLAEADFTAFVITITYPILDMMLFVPSMIILISLRKDDVQSIPWILSSLSLLVNAVADERYVNDFVNGRLYNLLFWDIFYVTDFIIMAGALFWYYRFHISPERRKTKITN